jgi:hypothetical protein
MTYREGGASSVVASGGRCAPMRDATERAVAELRGGSDRAHSSRPQAASAADGVAGEA